MRLGYDPYATLGGIDQKSRHGDLGSRMEMNFGLLDVHELTWLCGEEGNHDGKCLRDAEPDVGDADEIAGPAPLRVEQASDPELDLCVIDGLSLYLPGQAEYLEAIAQFFDRFC